MAVRLYVDQDLCISCGACIALCPDVFDWNDDEKAHVIVDPVPEDLEEDALRPRGLPHRSYSDKSKGPPGRLFNPWRCRFAQSSFGDR